MVNEYIITENELRKINKHVINFFNIYNSIRNNISNYLSKGWKTYSVINGFMILNIHLFEEVVVIDVAFTDNITGELNYDKFLMTIYSFEELCSKK